MGSGCISGQERQQRQVEFGVRSSEFSRASSERERERERETSQVKFILPPSTKQIETFLFSIPELLKTQAPLSAARERNGTPGF
jgi:hypothetical protein